MGHCALQLHFAPHLIPHLHPVPVLHLHPAACTLHLHHTMLHHLMSAPRILQLNPLPTPESRSLHPTLHPPSCTPYLSPYPPSAPHNPNLHIAHYMGILHLHCAVHSHLVCASYIPICTQTPHPTSAPPFLTLHPTHPICHLHMASPLQLTSVSCTPAHREGTAFQTDGIWPFLHFEHTTMGLGWAEVVLGNASPVLWAHLGVWVHTGAEGTCSAVSSGSSLMPESCSLLSASSSSSSFSQSCRRHKLGGPSGTMDTAWCRHRHRHGPHSSWGELPGSQSSGDVLPAGSAPGRYWMETTDGEMLDGEVGQGYIGWETLDQGAGWRCCLRRC